MKSKKKLFALLPSLLIALTIGACSDTGGGQSSSSIGEETSSVDPTPSSEDPSSTDPSSSSYESESSMQEDIPVTVTFDYGDIATARSVLVGIGETLTLTPYSKVSTSYECLSWSDGANVYAFDATITVYADMTLTGTFRSMDVGFTLSEDGTYYTVSTIIDRRATEIEIPDTYYGLPVTAVGSGVFSLTAVTKLTIPTSVTTIAYGALYGASNLVELTVPFIGGSRDSTDTIGYFFSTDDYRTQHTSLPSGLATITVSDQEVIPSYAFYGCSGIASVSLLNSKTISGRAFESMPSLTTVNLNEGLENIESHAFSSCSALTTLALPKSLIKFDNGIVTTAVTSLEIGPNLVTWSSTNQSLNLASISVDADNPNFSSVDGVLYNKDQTTLITYPAGKEGSSYALPDSVTTVGEYAFRSAKITSIYLNKVVSLEVDAFYYSALTSVTFPSTLTKLGSNAFSLCGDLASVTWAETPNGEFTIEGHQTFSSCESLTSMAVPSYVDAIPEYFVSSCSSLASITFAGSIQSIGTLAFAGTAIESIEITFKNAATIGERIFYNCSKLTTFIIHFEEGVTDYPTLEGSGFDQGFTPEIVCDSSAIAEALKLAWADFSAYIRAQEEVSSSFIIENGVLTGWTGGADETDIVIPDTVTEIGASVFYRNPYIHTVTIPESVTIINENNFNNCSSLLAVYWQGANPGTRTMFKRSGAETKFSSSNMFTSCKPAIIVDDDAAKTDLQSILTATFKNMVFTLEDNLQIGANEVYGDGGATLIKVTGASDEYALASNVTAIHESAFAYNCKGLTSVDLGSVVTIGASAFSNTGLTGDLTIPATVTSIGDSAFDSLDGITSVTILGACEIGGSAFTMIGELDSVYLADGVTSLGASAFEEIYVSEIVLPSSLTEVDCDAFANAEIATVYCCFSEDYANDTFSSGSDFLSSMSNYDEVVWDYTRA